MDQLGLTENEIEILRYASEILREVDRQVKNASFYVKVLDLEDRLDYGDLYCKVEDFFDIANLIDKVADFADQEIENWG
jgi:hypothetical protein